MQVCLMWLVWRKRNNCTFKDVESPIDHLNSLQIQTLFDWSWFLVLLIVLPFLVFNILLEFLFDLQVISSSTLCSGT